MSQDPHDQLLLQIRGAVAEHERALIAERMRRGRTAKLRAGVLLPWTRPPYGYRLDPERPRAPSGVQLDAAEAAVVTEIFAWYMQDGHSLFGVVRWIEQLGVPSPSEKKLWGLATLRSILTNPTYTGQVYAGRSRYQLMEVYLSSVIPLPEYQRRRDELERRLSALTQQTEQLQGQADRQSHLAQLTASVEDFCRRVQDGLAGATFEQCRELVELLIDRIVVTDEKAEIRYVTPTSPAGEKMRFCHLRSGYCRA